MVTCHSLQVNDLVKFGLFTLMIRTYYYLIGTYFYLGLVDGIVFSTSFDHCLIAFCPDFDGPALYHEVISGDL